MSHCVSVCVLVHSVRNCKTWQKRRLKHSSSTTTVACARLVASRRVSAASMTLRNVMIFWTKEHSVLLTKAPRDVGDEAVKKRRVGGLNRGLGSGYHLLRILDIGLPPHGTQQFHRIRFNEALFRPDTREKERTRKTCCLCSACFTWDRPFTVTWARRPRRILEDATAVVVIAHTASQCMTWCPIRFQSCCRGF